MRYEILLEYLGHAQQICFDLAVDLIAIGRSVAKLLTGIFSELNRALRAGVSQRVGPSGMVVSGLVVASFAHDGGSF